MLWKALQTPSIISHFGTTGLVALKQLLPQSLNEYFLPVKAANLGPSLFFSSSFTSSFFTAGTYRLKIKPRENRKYRLLILSLSTSKSWTETGINGAIRRWLNFFWSSQRALQEHIASGWPALAHQFWLPMIKEYSFNSKSFWSGVGCYTAKTFHLGQAFGICFAQRAFYYNQSRIKLILVCQEVLKWVWPSVNTNRGTTGSVALKQLLPLSMHHKWKGIIDFICETSNGIIHDKLFEKMSLYCLYMLRRGQILAKQY